VATNIGFGPAKKRPSSMVGDVHMMPSGRWFCGVSEPGKEASFDCFAAGTPDEVVRLVKAAYPEIRLEKICPTCTAMSRSAGVAIPLELLQ
jgi:hypothetical protein